MSLKNQLKNYLYERAEQNDGWVHKGELERFAMETGKLGDNASRRLRELAADGEVEVREAGKSIEYRYIQKEYAIA